MNESFLEDINNMLNSGEVPGMFAQDEKDRVAADIREWVIKQGGNPSKDACYAAFISRVRDNLHIVLTMSPVGEAFRARCAGNRAWGLEGKWRWLFLSRGN